MHYLSYCIYSTNQLIGSIWSAWNSAFVNHTRPDNYENCYVESKHMQCMHNVYSLLHLNPAQTTTWYEYTASSPCQDCWAGASTQSLICLPPVMTTINKKHCCIQATATSCCNNQSQQPTWHISASTSRLHLFTTASVFLKCQRYMSVAGIKIAILPQADASFGVTSTEWVIGYKIWYSKTVAKTDVT